MTTSEQLVADYLDRLYECARSLSRSQVEELMTDVREHVAAAIVEAGRDDEATVRTVLDRLGTPEDIVAAAAGSAGRSGAVPAESPRGWTWRETCAALLLVPGSVAVPVIGPAAGMVLTAGSTRWDHRAKRIAYALGAVGLLLPILLLLGVRVGFNLMAQDVRSIVAQTMVVPGQPTGSTVIPNVVGMTMEQAAQTLQVAGFRVEKVYRPSDSVAFGEIVSTDPEPGATQNIGAKVRMVISIG